MAKLFNSRGVKGDIDPFYNDAYSLKMSLNLIYTLLNFEDELLVH